MFLNYNLFVYEKINLLNFNIALLYKKKKN